MVKYRYDAWGNCNTTVVDPNASTIANLNPFRYRSYYYDTETGFYFLKTRYYDPEIGRFMTIDDIGYLDPGSINGLNLYAYCINNPLTYSDPLGLSATILIAIGISLLIGAVLGFATAAINDWTADGVLFNGSFTDYCFYIAMGAITGAISGACSGLNFFAQLGITFALNFASSLAESAYRGKIDINNLSSVDDALKSAINAGFISAISFSLTAGITQKFIKVEYNRMIGNSKTNLQINRALANAGHSAWKIGNMGLQGIYNRISEFIHVQAFNYVTGFFLDFSTILLQK